jgi:hypothetical protein
MEQPPIASWSGLSTVSDEGHLVAHRVEDAAGQKAVSSRLGQSERLDEVPLSETMQAAVVCHPRGEKGCLGDRWEQLSADIVRGNEPYEGSGEPDEDQVMAQDATRLYEQGWSIRQVADRFECSYGVMRRILKGRVTLRTQGGLPRASGN